MYWPGYVTTLELVTGLMTLILTLSADPNMTTCFNYLSRAPHFRLGQREKPVTVRTGP